MLFEFILLVVIGLFAFFKWMKSNDDYFAKRNLAFKKPTFLLGNTGKYLFRKKSTLAGAMQEIYNWFPDEKMFGLFDYWVPLVVIRDPELLKHLTVKNIEHFEDRRSITETVPDDLLGNTLVVMQGQRWRDMRGTLSPAFTGSKMRKMFDLVTECADEMTKYILKQAAGSKIDLEMKNVFSRFTNDVIASCAFGIRVNSFENPDNELLVMWKKLQSSTVSQTLKFLIIVALPQLAKKFDIHVISNDVSNFFKSMVMDTMAERKKHGIIRHDMINILMELRQGNLTDDGENSQKDSAGFATAEESNIGKKMPQTHWSDSELVAQCLIFYLAGLDTTSTTLTFLTYELCINPDIQRKLYEEIVETNENLGGKRISYDTLQKMKYLDQVISEGLRKWPIAPMTDRLCVKDFECEYGDNAKFKFEKGVPFWIPIHGLHHDPNYYPDPEKFDPERFSDENKRNIVPGTYLPFGIGPRNCIGSRFALMELKASLFYILLNFSLEANAQSQIPIRLKKFPFLTQADKGFHLDLNPRTHY